MCSADGVRIAIVLTRGTTIDRGLNQHMNTMVPWRVSSRCRISFVLPQLGSWLTICRTLRPADVSENKKKVVQSPDKELTMTIYLRLHGGL